MEAVPRMPMIWLDLKEAGDFHFTSACRQYIQRNYGENPENYSDALRKLEQLRQSAINVSKDFEGCNTLRKYFGQLHFLQSRVPMALGQEAASPVTWTDIFSGKDITHEDISYEQACVLYNLGALHSFLGAMDNRVSEEGMKTSCTHFQSSAGAFAYIRDNYNNNYSSDVSHQTLSINISLMLAQAQECLLEKTLLDNRKSLLIARISAQVRDYYRECVRVLENSEWVFGRKEWKKLIHMKISYYSALTHLHMGKQSEEQQKFGEAVAYLQRALDRLNEAIKLSKGQPDSVQSALRFTMDVIGGKFNSAKKDNDFIYHESVPNLDTLPAVKGVSLVKPTPVTPADTSVTGPDLFSKLVPMATHEASSLYSEEKAKLLRDVIAKIEKKNQILERFMDSLNCECVDNLDTFNTLPPVLLEKCAALSVRPDAVKSLAQAMQALSSVYTDVGATLEEVQGVLKEDEAGEKSLLEVVGQKAVPPRAAALQELQTELKKFEAAHQTASSTNTELHTAMNQHIPNLRLLQGALEELKKSLPQPQLSEEDTSSLQGMKRLLGKVDEMRQQRLSLEKQLRELIQKDDITSVLVTTERYQMKSLFEEQLQKYEQLKGYIEQNLNAQDNVLKALTDANVQYASVRKTLTLTEQQWKSSVQSLVASYEAFEDLVKKAEEGRSFYEDLDKKITSLLERAKAVCQKREEERVAIMGREVGKGAPPRPTARKPVLGNTASAPPGQEDLPQELRCIPPNVALAGGVRPPNVQPRGAPQLSWAPGAAPFAPTPFPNQQVPQLAHPTQPSYGQAPGVPPPSSHYQPRGPGYVLPQQFQPGVPRGPMPASAQLNPHTAQVPSPWHQTPPSVATQVGPQSAVRPGMPGHQFPMPGGQFASPAGQPMQSGLGPSPAQQIPPGTQYQSFPPQPGQGIASQAPRAVFPGPSQPPVHPGQFQSPVPTQSQSQPGPAPVYWPSVAPQTQYPGPVPGTQPQRAPLPGHQTPQSQSTPQMPFGQSAPMPFGYQPQMPPGAARPPQPSMYFQAGAPSQPQFPPTQHGMGQQPMTHPQFQPGNPLQNQGFPPQPAAGSVMDNPNPPALAGVLTPSPAHPSPHALPNRMEQLSINTQQGGDVGRGGVM